jgi:hypothetical protein
VAAAILAGCGGGGGGPLTKSEFIAQGDAICKQAHDQFAALQKNPPSSAPEYAAYTERSIAVVESEVTKIRDLDAPDEVRPALDRYLKALEQTIGFMKKGLHAAQNKDAQAFAAAQAQAAAGQVKRLKLAQAVGFTQCSRPVGPTSTAGG